MLCCVGGPASRMGDLLGPPPRSGGAPASRMGDLLGPPPASRMGDLLGPPPRTPHHLGGGEGRLGRNCYARVIGWVEEGRAGVVVWRVVRWCGVVWVRRVSLRYAAR